MCKATCLGQLGQRTAPTPPVLDWCTSLILQLELGPTLACLPHQKKRSWRQLQEQRPRAKKILTETVFGFYSDFFAHVTRKKNLACMEY